MDDSRADKQVILQRIRNRMMQYLECASNYESQLEYQRNVPSVSVPNEMINQWEDWYDHDPEMMGSPVFSRDERDAVVAFDLAWNGVADRTPDPLPKLSEAQLMKEWAELREAARRCLEVFNRRGFLSDDDPI